MDPLGTELARHALSQDTLRRFGRRNPANLALPRKADVLPVTISALLAGAVHADQRGPYGIQVNIEFTWLTFN